MHKPSRRYYSYATKSNSVKKRKERKRKKNPKLIFQYQVQFMTQVDDLLPRAHKNMQSNITTFYAENIVKIKILNYPFGFYN